MKMVRRARLLSKLSFAAVLLAVAAAACTTETIEVTRIKILERRVIERVPVTVEVTRIQRVTNTPRSTEDDAVPPTATVTPESSSTPSPAAATPTLTRAPAAPTRTPIASQTEVGQELVAALKSTEQILLALIQALNSNPLPAERTVELYDALKSMPVLTVAEADTQLQSIHIRYREQVDYALGQATDLYQHLVKIKAGEAAQTTVSPIHLGLAQEAAAVATSNVQALIRELESVLAAQQ